MIHPAKPQRILIVKPSALGDVVTAMPILRSLRKKFPDAHIAWLIRDDCADIIVGDGDINEIIIFERKKLGRAWKSPSSAAALWKLLRRLRKERYDWTIDLQGLFRSAFFTWSTRSPARVGFADAREGATLFYNQTFRVGALHTVDRNLELANQIGLDAKPDEMLLQISHDAKNFVAGELAGKKLSAGKYLVCVPPTTWTTKSYPIRHWRSVIGELVKQIPVIVLGSPSRKEMALCDAVCQGIDGVINFGGKTTVSQMVAVIASSAGVICCDSAAKFIAPAVGVDCVTLIGPTQIERTGPYLKGNAIIAPVPCQGCLRKRCSHISCMEMISPQTVVQAAMAMLKGRSDVIATTS